MSRNTCLILSGAVIGSFLAQPAIAQQNETAEQAARTAAQSSFEDIDTDLNGSISRTELRAAVGAENADELFNDMDANGNDEISRAEWTSWRRQQAAQAAERRNQVEVGISGDTIEGRYLTDGGMVGLDRASLGLGLFFSTDRHLVGQGQLMVPGVFQGIVPGFLSLSVGGRAHVAFLADPDDEVFDLAPGVEARLSLPFDTPMAIVGSVFYAPEIFTFGDADQVWDANVRFEVQFLQNTTGFVGYRFIDYDREEGGDDEIVESFQFGLRFAF
jgi:YfaZ precursor